MGTALLNYHLQNQPIHFSAKTNDVTNQNLAVTWPVLLSEDSYLGRVPSGPEQPREAGREGMTACTGPRGHERPQRPRGFFGTASASESGRPDPSPGSKASAEGAPYENHFPQVHPQIDFPSTPKGLTLCGMRTRARPLQFMLHSDTGSVVINRVTEQPQSSVNVFVKCQG